MREPLGLESKTVRVVPYDDRWPSLFEAEAARILEAVERAGVPAVAIEHVGSTAVPGLARSRFSISARDAKRAFAGEFPRDREGYITGKTDFVERVLRGA